MARPFRYGKKMQNCRCDLPMVRHTELKQAAALLTQRAGEEISMTDIIRVGVDEVLGMKMGELLRRVEEYRRDILAQEETEG